MDDMVGVVGNFGRKPRGCGVLDRPGREYDARSVRKLFGLPAIASALLCACAHTAEPIVTVQIPVATKLKLEQLPDRPTFPELRKINPGARHADVIKAYVFALNQSMSYARQQEEILNALVIPRS